ncbi:MAG: hypothetical protein ABIZ04_11730 [Opitutus sp.]
MSQSLASPSPIESFRQTFRRMWEDRDSRSVIVGIAGMVLVHLLLFFIAPRMLQSDSSASVIRPHSSSKEFSIELTPDMFAKAPPKQPMNFVEANPNAPDNVPDQTNNFAAQNQQVAQEKPTENTKTDRPALEGQKEIQSSQIVTGQLTQPVESTPAPAAPEQQEKAAETAPKLEQIPLTGFEKTEGESEAGVGSNIAKFAEGAKAVPERVEGLKDVPLIEGATTSQPRIDPMRPRPRPQVVKQQQVRPAIFQENKIGTQNIGAIAYDAKWSNYGQYLQKMIEAVQIQWERILIESRVSPPSGTTVKVVFRMNTEGRISQIVSVDGTAGNQAEKACTSAITSRAPYGPWTEDMIAVLGDSQELTFNFFYQ